MNRGMLYRASASGLIPVAVFRRIPDEASLVINRGRLHRALASGSIPVAALNQIPGEVALVSIIDTKMNQNFC